MDASQWQAVRFESFQQCHLYTYSTRLWRQSQCDLFLRSRHEQSGILGPCRWRYVGSRRPRDQCGRNYVYRHGDGKWDPENGIYGNGIVGVKLNPQSKALELSDYYGPSNAEWLAKRDLDMQVTPAIFNYKGKELMVDAGKECRVYLWIRNQLAATIIARLFTESPPICNEDVNFASAGIWGSMATWEDAQGTRWVLTPFWGAKHSKFKAPIENGEVKDGAIAAFKVEDKNGTLQLVPAWISRNMNRAEPPVVANGVVFAYGNGEDTDQAYPDVGLADVAERRIPGSTQRGALRS